ncbi:TIR domain-containing protein [Vibrio algarum]|uniref:TIR domain-containing protein n=1 Tax=Vibrio algarum TaxID=3020714 RepID=A0ABT4YT94_9VIBR|nr:TIR domain-containing protein [Vibrio sp. KJ40-1]MDB1124690.1 TIR domain-containing protein [Vibrio sp. KJ40-1]
MPLPLFVGLSTAIAVGVCIVNGRKKKVFISYYSKGDSHYKNLILAWAKSKKFKLNIEDYSTDTRIRSENEAYLKQKMRSQIQKADYFIVFIGEDTHRRKWVSWEIEQAKKLNKTIIAVKEQRTHKSPTPLLKSGAIWVYKFSEENLRKAMS